MGAHEGRISEALLPHQQNQYHPEGDNQLRAVRRRAISPIMGTAKGAHQNLPAPPSAQEATCAELLRWLGRRCAPNDGFIMWRHLHDEKRRRSVGFIRDIK